MNKFENIAIGKINNKCQNTNIVFKGFVDGVYKNVRTKLYLKCNKCNYEWNTTSYDNFTRQTNCPNCAEINKKHNIDEVLSNIQKRCQDENVTFINFENNEYKNNLTKLKLKCNKCGYEWLTSYKNFVLSKTSCPVEKKSNLEKQIKQMLIKNKIDFIEQCHFPFLNKLSVDFYIPSKLIAIECQGKQHFIPTNFGDNDETIIQEKFRKQIQNDKEKFTKCKENGISILYYSNINYDANYELITDIEKLKQKIIGE